MTLGMLPGFHDGTPDPRFQIDVSHPSIFGYTGAEVSFLYCHSSKREHMSASFSTFWASVSWAFFSCSWVFVFFWFLVL